VLILAACTQSKRGAVPLRRRLRHHEAAGSPAAVADTWGAALREPARGARRLTDLYKGGYWSAALDLRDSLPGADLGVVSAGLGFVPAAAAHSPYSATFSSGHPDSVPGASQSSGRAEWWQLLGASDRLRAAIDSARQVLVVLPNRYLDVVADDLLGRDRGHVLVFASECPRPLSDRLGERLFRVRAPMVRRLGTNVSALAPKAAAFALAGGAGELGRVHRRLATLMADSEQPLYPSREKQTPDQVAAWLRAALASDEPPTSATAALRSFRGSGRAFEQKRFHRLFHQVVESTRGTP